LCKGSLSFKQMAHDLPISSWTKSLLSALKTFLKFQHTSKYPCNIYL
jgi:hypothetical protein